tara:strand:+ start:1768 stop:2010 length:243 start_codon:yes stop_codon:yes gene_type:complete
MSHKEERDLQKEAVAKNIRLVCEQEISVLEDKLPRTEDLLEKDQFLKEIDALNQIAEEANARAELIIKEAEEKLESKDVI